MFICTIVPQCSLVFQYQSNYHYLLLFMCFSPNIYLYLERQQWLVKIFRSSFKTNKLSLIVILVDKSVEYRVEVCVIIRARTYVCAAVSHDDVVAVDPSHPSVYQQFVVVVTSLKLVKYKTVCLSRKYQQSILGSFNF